MIIIWQISGFGIIISLNKKIVEALYRLYAASSTGFIFVLLPLSLSIADGKKKKLIVIISTLLFAAISAGNMSINIVEELYIGNSGFYVPVLSEQVLILNMPAILVLIASFVYAIVLIRRTESALVRHRLYYFLIASLIIFIGLFSNMIPLKDYPVDILCAILSGLLLSYAVIQKRLLNIKKTFFRGLFLSVMIAGSTGLFILFLYFFTLISDNSFPVYSIFPAFLTLVIIFLILSKTLLPASSVLNNVDSIYMKSAEEFERKVKKLQSFNMIFDELYEAMIKEWTLERFSVHLLDRTAGELSLILMKPEKQFSEIKEVIELKSPLMLSLKYNEILLLDEFYTDKTNISISCSLSEIYGKYPPDIILPVKISGEVIGIIIIRLAESGNFLDKEDVDFILNLNRLTTEAVTGAYAYEQLEQEVFRKDNLIKDVNHRVKNNLQMISGLLSLQSISSDNPDVIEAIDTAKQRIQTIAKIHEMLYIRGVVDTVNLKSYTSEIVKSFAPAVSSAGIELTTDISEIEIESEKALTVCLVINELLSNSVKYAFKNSDSGLIKISLKISTENQLICIIKDNGCGYSESIEKTAGIGHNLVKSFITKQLKGTWDVDSDSGTTHTINIPLTI